MTAARRYTGAAVLCPRQAAHFKLLAPPSLLLLAAQACIAIRHATSVAARDFSKYFSMTLQAIYGGEYRAGAGQMLLRHFLF